ncbi:MAG: hypothetical protein FJ207_13880 [Gemmatimonadetes bacterium]|nr:hypothetical protein [Gemmatimonadota bacterium]
MSRRLAYLAFPLAAVFAASGRDVGAQASPACTYDTCALRVAYSPAGAALVRGTDQVVVNGLGLWSGDMRRAFEGNRLSQDLANGYRVRHNAGTVLSVAGGILFFGGLLASDGNISIDLDTNSLVTLGGLALTVVGTRVSVSGDDHLSRAIWEYNRTLAR